MKYYIYTFVIDIKIKTKFKIQIQTNIDMYKDIDTCIQIENMMCSYTK